MPDPIENNPDIQRALIDGIVQLIDSEVCKVVYDALTSHYPSNQCGYAVLNWYAVPHLKLDWGQATDGETLKWVKQTMLGKYAHVALIFGINMMGLVGQSNMWLPTLMY